MKKVKKSKKTYEYFDDCLICQAMEEVEKKGKSLRKEELEIAFAKQNLENRFKR